jgi:prepilin-type N-terminal cleavage/methylation domain-containing protein
MQNRTESGFTLIELMAVTLIGAILLGLGGLALKQFSRAKALESAHTTTRTQLRAVQQRTFTEGYPRAYGIRYLKGGSSWDLVRYDAAAATCTVVEKHRLPDTVVVATSTDFPDSTAATACRSAAPSSTNYEVALFYARGSATPGTVTFQLAGTSKTRSISVNGATGRAS